MVERVNSLAERGFREGLDSGHGVNGPQLVLGGMRAGQGFSAGLGYRRSDLWQERLGYRATARGTLQYGYMFDVDLDFQGLRTERAALQWYTKFEHSPHIDYYGFGNQSSQAQRTSYSYDDFTTDFSATYQPGRWLRLGATGGYLHPHTGPGSEDLPPIDEHFPADSLPGFEADTHYMRIGVFAYVDSRDSRTGPRSGHLFGARYREYWDVGRKTFAFRQSEFEFQQYLPYFNRAASSRFAPRRSCPTQRVTTRCRCTCSRRWVATTTCAASGRIASATLTRSCSAPSIAWHVSSLLDMAAFVDGGKVVPLKRDVNPESLHYSGGVGFRVRTRVPAVVNRIDFAGSPEGFRWRGRSAISTVPRWW
jgi:hypothetical protein